MSIEYIELLAMLNMVSNMSLGVVLSYISHLCFSDMHFNPSSIYPDLICIMCQLKSNTSYNSEMKCPTDNTPHWFR